jgi:hypothetical protein
MHVIHEVSKSFTLGDPPLDAFGVRGRAVRSAELPPIPIAAASSQAKPKPTPIPNF